MQIRKRMNGFVTVWKQINVSLMRRTYLITDRRNKYAMKILLWHLIDTKIIQRTGLGTIQGMANDLNWPAW